MMRALIWRTVQQQALLGFSSSLSLSSSSSSSSPSRLWRTPFFSSFSAMASSDDASRPLDSLHQSVHNQASGSADQETLLPSDRVSSPETTETKAASTQEHSGHALREQEGREAVKFQLKSSCVLTLQRGDITKWSVDRQTDAIVNAANTRMLGGGGVDGAIHRAAGPDLYEACLELPLVGKNIRCRTGDAVITKGFRLPVSKIVHTAGPVYVHDEISGPLLESSYKSVLLLAVNNEIKYLAFPAISCGIYGYPYDKAAEIALNTVNENSAGLKEVHFVLFEEGSWVQWLSEASRNFERLEE